MIVESFIIVMKEEEDEWEDYEQTILGDDEEDDNTASVGERLTAIEESVKHLSSQIEKLLEASKSTN